MTRFNAIHVIAKVLADGGEARKAGPIGLVVIVLLCVACYFLFKSMSKHLKKVRDEFPSMLPADRPHQSVPSTSMKRVPPVDGADPSIEPRSPFGPAQDDSSA